MGKKENGTGIKSRKEGNEVVQGQETEKSVKMTDLYQAVLLTYMHVISAHGVFLQAGMRKKEVE